MMIKAIFTIVFCCAFFFCSAQKQLLTYADLQYIIQNKPTQVTGFLTEKNFQVLPGSDADGLHFLALIADQDYTDVAVVFEKRRTKIHLNTTDVPQFALIQKALQNYTGKNSKGFTTVYRVKDEAFATIRIKENEPQVNSLKVYTIDLEN